MTDFTDLTDAADDEMDLPHYGPDVQMPCFACFVDSILDAANDFDTTAAKQHALNLALTQIADCMGTLFVEFAADPVTGVDIFTARIREVIALATDAPAAPVAITPAPNKHHH
jgi:hypothetical protein